MTRKMFRSLAGAALLATTLFAVDAAAYGNYHVRSTEVQESGGQWHIYVRLNFPRAPALAHTPMRFIFTEETQYERALTDNSKEPVLNRVPLQNQMPKIESLDVDFADGTGKIFKTTNFDFSLSRARGYEAGEYKMQIRKADGTDIGGSTTIILKGNNPVVDRRSITFSAKSDKKDKDKKVAQNDTASAVPTSTEVQAVGTPPPFIPDEGFQKTKEEEIQTKPGGCGCDVPGTATSSAAVLGVLVGLGALAARRRRRAA
jgi:MYXO-CTERM domain-containing protein